MPHVSGIGTWLAPGSASAANNSSDDIDSTLAPGSNYYGAGDTGAAGEALIQNASNISDVGANFHPMDTDSAALGALSTTYLNNYMNGGLLTAAAKAQAQSDLAHMNASQLREGSQQTADAVSKTKQSEDSFNASQATTNRAQAAALQLKKAAMQMLISHTNNMSALARQKIQAGVAQIDQRNAQSLQSAADQTRANQMNIYEGGRMQAAQNAMGVGTAVASAGAAAGGTLANMLNSQTPSLGTSSTASLTETPQSYSYNSTDGGTTSGYATPTYSAKNLGTGLSKLALVSGTPNYNPYVASDTNQAYASKDSWGKTSLNNTLPR